MAKGVRERFDAKWALDPKTGCWMWLAAVDRGGYGVFSSPLTGGQKAHRHGWVLYRGPIPDGMVLDHIVCRTRSCVNPDHLRLVTQKVNALENTAGFGPKNKQKTHCSKGHEYTPENTRMKKNPRLNAGRQCRACEALREPRNHHAVRKTPPAPSDPTEAR